jgi:hypothetical protein
MLFSTQVHNSYSRKNLSLSSEWHTECKLAITLSKAESRSIITKTNIGLFQRRPQKAVEGHFTFYFTFPLISRTNIRGAAFILMAFIFKWIIGQTFPLTGLVLVISLSHRNPGSYARRSMFEKNGDFFSWSPPYIFCELKSGFVDRWKIVPLE